MTSELNREALLLRFDDLVARNIIHYAPRKTVQIEDAGFALEFHISPSLVNKPAYEQAFAPLENAQNAQNTHSDDVVSKPVCFGPGSDISKEPGLLINTIRDTHLLVVNKFCVFRPQLLLLTHDSYRRQYEPLAFEDFAAVCTVFSSLKSRHLAIYNCSSTAGASREHKHVQILPRPPQLFPDIQSSDTQAIPFRYFLRSLRDIDFERPESHTMLFEIYKELLSEAKRAAGEALERHDEDHFPHNVGLVKEWIIVIPRRTNNFEDITANAAGMLGSVWLTSDAQLARWKEIGPRKALAGLGVPASSHVPSQSSLRKSPAKSLANEP